MKRFLSLVISLLWASSLPALAEDAPISPLSAGDSWTYRGELLGKSTGDGWINVTLTTKNSSNEFFVFVNEADTKEKLDADLQAKKLPRQFGAINADFCALDFVLRWSLTERPCTAALKVGETWKTKDSHGPIPAGTQLKVIKSEKIKLPAGTFDALVIEMNITPAPKASPPGTAAVSAPKLHALYWYAPAIKAMLKEEIKGVDASGKVVLNATVELQKFVVR